ncbi:glycogen debranching enzyme family protein [Leptolyngbya cf. ectocarpi LEGE 11479]|uniref:Glycogen debranching enzyme family protein n=1 Tax=Leptolyngbya cf. ectocarpi LEGE 11479 TaxID=1828722 RepID=A0A928ZYP7_LEPEC|nr:amylo-alpha-1,6-glucosidase [Leptolyngbya ectocarpi]MBE9069868.1 glycogen debranching enzyme family protein [Leptolyngbya cf. ectocarpi LEGE 11479]
MLTFGREICGELATAEAREWLVTNGIGGYASGTIAGLLSRRYHGLLVAALQPPLGRTLLVTKLDETVYAGGRYDLSTNRWLDGSVTPEGYRFIESFRLEGTTPVWTFALGDALLEKRIWMEPRENTTYVRYHLQRGSIPIELSLRVLVNYRDYHSNTQGQGWQMKAGYVPNGVCVHSFAEAVPYYLLSNRGEFQLHHDWYQDFDLALERYRGLNNRDDHLCVASLLVELAPEDSVLLAASTRFDPSLDSEAALASRSAYEQSLLEQAGHTENGETSGQGLTHEHFQQLVLAADQFIVDRPLVDEPEGKTVIAGYPWFGDWGRDTMISLPGLTLATGRPTIARTIIRTFARYLDQGMLPNLFPDAGETPEYNTVDAILWYFEAIRAYYAATGDEALLHEIWPELTAVIDWHQRGTRYNIHLDSDGLIYAGETGVQLTWMDAKVGDWVVTPRIGKPIEISALWYNALRCMEQFAGVLHKPVQDYKTLAQHTLTGFQRFWQGAYCYDVLDGPDDDDGALCPNQIFAVSLPFAGGRTASSLLTNEQQRAVVEVCGRELLTSHGLRSLAPSHPQYVGTYGGDPLQRDGAYHQGTTWGWLLGPYAEAHYRVYGDAAQSRALLKPLVQHINGSCIGTLSEIFDGDAPMAPRGCFAQAWTVAEVLRVWRLLESL